MIENFKRPPLRYPGSKFTLSKWIVPYLPRTKSFVDLFMGAGGIWHYLPRYELETAVELNQEITNFFQVMRYQTDDLIEAINWTLWSEAELALCYEPAEDALEQARRTFVRSYMAMGGLEKNRSGWRLIKQYSSRAHIPAKMEFFNIEHLHAVADRFRGVQICNRDMFEILLKFLNQPSTTIYADPPYLLQTRRRKYYKHELTTGDHARLASLLKRHKGPVVISGKPHPLYSKWYEQVGWQVVTKKSRSQTGKQDQQECLWLNPVCISLLKNERLEKEIQEAKTLFGWSQKEKVKI